MRFRQYNTKFQMEQLLLFLSSSCTDRALSRLRSLNLHCEEYTDPKALQKLIKNQGRKRGGLHSYLRAVDRLPSSPEGLIKQAVFYHLSLQNTDRVDQDEAIAFINHLLHKCHQSPQNEGDGEGNDPSMPAQCRSSCNGSQVSTRQDQTFIGKEIFLISKIAKPYLRYLLKLISILDEYSTLEGREATEASICWQLINMLRSITAFTDHFTAIGRYFMKEYGSLVLLLTQVVTTDLRKYMGYVTRFLRQQNYLLSCSGRGESAEITQFVNMMSELNTINEQLMQVFLGKYFHGQLKTVKQPSWLNTNCSEFDTIFRLAHPVPSP